MWVSYTLKHRHLGNAYKIIHNCPMKISIWNSPKGSAQFIVVHVGLRLPLSPLPGDLVWVCQLELAVGALPGDDVRVGGV